MHWSYVFLSLIHRNIMISDGFIMVLGGFVLIIFILFSLNSVVFVTNAGQVTIKDLGKLISSKQGLNTNCVHIEMLRKNFWNVSSSWPKWRLFLIYHNAIFQWYKCMCLIKPTISNYILQWEYSHVMISLYNLYQSSSANITISYSPLHGGW